ncbi:NUDIX domain-containing protein [Aestuariibius sp. HNIBRBA575]|uniref:NUDIX domain-containing protein n=1 Tax=Aestuariibius sp. HNIBRBA575 TaxID=3233343 RepID=UPI0034A286D1
MTPLFIYGTLCHLPLLHVVLGRTDVKTRADTLPDHGVYWVKDEAFPMIERDVNKSAQGLVLHDLSETDIARLNFYESGFDYDLKHVDLADGTAVQVYFPQKLDYPKGADWNISDWAKIHGDLVVETAQLVMGYFNKVGEKYMSENNQNGITQSRAWNRILARDTAPTDLRRNVPEADMTITPRDGGFDGFFQLKPVTLKHRKLNGDWSPEMPREVFIGYDAALVLPYDPVRDQVLMVEQLRLAPKLRGDLGVSLLEPIAGMVDASEAPETAARREAEEEAGLTLTDLELITRSYPAPGYVTEFHHCYLALASLEGRDGHIGGAVEENEDIRVHVLSFDRAMQLCDSGEINVGPLFMMLMWLARHRDRLRATA